MNFIDTHAHLNVKQFVADQDAVIKTAEKAGVTKIINVGCSYKYSETAIELARKYPRIWATVGTHPHDAAEMNKKVVQQYIDWAKDSANKVVALGEMGLDFYRNYQLREVQERALMQQLELVQEVDLPVIIHSRNAQGSHEADERVLDMLIEKKVSRAVFHCFGGDLEFAKRLWSYGYYTSFTGVVTFPKAVELKRVVAEVPLERFMLETDCPFMAPQKVRGQRNEPQYIPEIAEEIARIKKMELAEVAKITTRNAEEFFGI